MTDWAGAGSEIVRACRPERVRKRTSRLVAVSLRANSRARIDGETTNGQQLPALMMLSIMARCRRLRWSRSSAVSALWVTTPAAPVWLNRLRASR